MRRFVCLLAISIGVGACASAKLTVTRPLAQPVSRVALKVEPVGTAATTIRDEQRSQLRSSLTSSLARRGVTLVPSDEAGVSLLDGKVEVYDEGNRAMRYFIGFGAGRGKFSSTWVVNDATGNSLGECRIDGSIAMGAFGGSYHDVVEKVGDRLGEFLNGSQ